MKFSLIRWLIPNQARPIRIMRGPFRDARICLNPHDNLRKIFGLYEHELNDWLDFVLPSVDTVIDVGANDGYFTFGCAAAFRRLGKHGEIVAFEPQQLHFDQLRKSLALQPRNQDARISVDQNFVGGTGEHGCVTLDHAVPRILGSRLQQVRRALLKVDVEGAELSVIEGAANWMRPTNFFLIEVHDTAYLEILKKRFAASGITLTLRLQRPLAVLGRERRAVDNCWLVSDLNQQPTA